MSEKITRNFVVPVYALAILQEVYCRPPLAAHQWHVINNAIAEHWSWSAVVTIKNRAWKMAAELAKGQDVPSS